MEPIRQLFALALRGAVLAASLATAVCMLFPSAIMSLYSSDPAVIRASASYLRVLSASFVLYGFSNCYIMCLRGVEQVNVSMAIYGTSFFVNVFFNYGFIFGNLGMPALGIQGAALGTVIARAYETVLAVFYMQFREKSVGFTLPDLFSLRTRLMPDFIRSALPVTGNELLWGIGFSITSAVIGRLGNAFTAANSIASVVLNILTVFVFGMSAATAVIVGRTIGEGNVQEATRMAHTLMLLCCTLGVVLGGLLLLIRTPVLAVFSVSAETYDIAYQLLTVMALLAPLQAFANNMIVGVMRGGGDVAANFWLDCGTLWLVSIPLGIAAGFIWYLPPVWVFLLMRADYLAKFILGMHRLRSGRWIRVMTR